MRSLFWKIFLSFWVAMLALTIAVAWSTYQLRDIESENVMAKAYTRFVQNTRSAVDTLQRQGIHGLQRWLEFPQNRKATTLYLLTLDGRQILGEPIPARVLNMAQTNSLDPFQRRPQWLFTEIIKPFGEPPYRLVTTFKRPHPLEMLFTASRIGIALLISGLVCFWLARHISKPISRLRHATQKLSEGDLSVRVSGELGRRHDELANLGQDFDRMAEQLQTLLSSQHQLIRDVSHELRSPLARLQVALELARQRSHGTVENELDRIEQESERLNELIGQVLALARMETQQTQIKTRDMDICPLIESIVQDAQYEAQANQRNIIITHREACTLAVNETLLHSAIENVVRNALKYTEQDSSVELSLENTADGCLIKVRDYGSGVPDNTLKDMFKPFVRISDARDRDSGGYGLGLAIAERAIGLHGGQISAHNAEGGGLRIEIRLPTKKAS